MTVEELIDAWIADPRITATASNGCVSCNNKELYAYGRWLCREVARGEFLINGDWHGFSYQWIKKRVRKAIPDGCLVIVQTGDEEKIDE